MRQNLFLVIVSFAITCHQEIILESARLDLPPDIFVFTTAKFEEFL